MVAAAVTNMGPEVIGLVTELAEVPALVVFATGFDTEFFLL